MSTALQFTSVFDPASPPQKLKAWGSPNLKTVRKLIQDKGQRECIDIFIESVKNANQSPIPFQEMYEVQKWLLYANKKKLVNQ